MLYPVRLFLFPLRTSGASHSAAGSQVQPLMEHVNELQDPAQAAAISSITFLAGEKQRANSSRILV